VTAIWLHHDKALGGKDHGRERNLSALVKVATDYFDCGFVPGHDEVVVLDGEGTVFVPFAEEPR
jgi:hypothetical protein